MLLKEWLSKSSSITHHCYLMEYSKMNNKILQLGRSTVRYKTSRKSAGRGSFMYAFRFKMMLFNTDGFFFHLKIRKPLSILKRKNQNNNIFQALSTPLKHYCTPLKNCFSVCTSNDRRLLTSVIVCNVDQCGWTDTIMNLGS